MGKKKKRKAAMPPPPDPRRVALASHIDREVAKLQEEEESHKNTLQPLKKVISNPMIHEFVPMARNMFADSKSVDFGFDGAVDIPNQAIYLEECPEDEEFDKEPPDDFPSTMSLGFMYTTDIEDDEFEKLDNLESPDNDSWRFLKARLGREKFQTLQESPQYQTLLTMPEPEAEEEEIPDPGTTNEADEGGGWLSFPTSIFGGWWGTRTEEDQEASDKARSRAISVVDPPDASKIPPENESSTLSLEDETLSKRRRSRTAKEKWLLFRSRMWNKSQRSKEYERSEGVAGSNVTLNDVHSTHNNSVDEDIHLVTPKQSSEEDLGNEKSRNCSGKKKCTLLLLVLLAIVIVGVGGSFAAANFGVYIPFLSETLFSILATNSSSVVDITTNVASITSVTSTTSVATTTSTSTTTTVEETTVYETVIESLDEIEVIPGMSPLKYYENYPYILGLVTADLNELNGEVFYVSSYVDVDPPTKEFSDAVGIVVYDAFRYLGFEVGYLTVSAGKFGSNLRLYIFVFGRPETNAGLLKWYGYRKDDSTTDSTPFTRRLTKILPIVIKERRATVLGRFIYLVGNDFMRAVEKYMDVTDVQRAPYRVPDEWGNCDGVSVCPLGDI